MTEYDDSGHRANTGVDSPPAANQARTEPVPSAPEHSPRPPGSPRVPSEPTKPAVAAGGVPSPGDAHGVPVPSVHAAAGSSEGIEAVRGVRSTAITAPGKPDGEVDTRA